MRIEIEIPKEFEEHFKQDKFEDTLNRLNADAHLIAGNYEKETVIMLIKAFKESKPAYDPDAVVEQLKEHLLVVEIEDEHIIPESDVEEYFELEVVPMDMAIDIVRNAGKDGAE